MIFKRYHFDFFEFWFLAFNKSDAIRRIIKEKFIFGFRWKPSRKLVQKWRISLFCVFQVFSLVDFSRFWLDKWKQSFGNFLKSLCSFSISQSSGAWHCRNAINKYFPVVEGATLSIGASRDLLFRIIRTRPESKFIFEISEKTFQVINWVKHTGTC